LDGRQQSSRKRQTAKQPGDEARRFPAPLTVEQIPGGGFRRNVLGALKLGVWHGALCIGCCWVLMTLLFVGGVTFREPDPFIEIPLRAMNIPERMHADFRPLAMEAFHRAWPCN
jgi:hypothetical protein